MKTFIKHILKFAIVATVFMTGASFAMAGQFDPNPADGPTGFVSISEDTAINPGDCSGCANQNTQINVNIPDYGDTDQFSVYIDFRNQGTGNITNTRGRLNISGSTITGILSGSGADPIQDSVSLNNLPVDYEINFVSARISNTSGTDFPAFCAGYDYENYSVTESQIFSTGANIGTLEDVTLNGGWCTQGYLIVTLEVVNNEEVVVEENIPEIETEQATGVNENSATINGYVAAGENVNVWFQYSTNENVNCTNNGTFVQGPNSENEGDDFSRLITGLNNNTTYYFVACGQTDDGDSEGIQRQFTTDGDIIVDPTDTTVETRTVNTFDENSAVLRGRLTQGENVDVYFVYDDSNNFSCTSGGTKINVATNVDATFPFEEEINGLNDNTTYYYYACAEDNGDYLATGFQEDFTTDGDIIVDPTDTTVETRTVNTFDENSAVLRGRLTQGENVDVYFVYDDSNNFSCTSGGTKINVATNVDATFPFEEEINGLNDNTTYYYYACAEDNGDYLATGFQEDFTTDGDGNNPPNELSVETLDETNKFQTTPFLGTATLNGEVQSGTSQSAFFVYSASDSTPSCINPGNAITVPAQDFDQPYGPGDNFSYTGTFGLDTVYHYRACISANQVTAIGQVIDFEISSDDGPSTGNDDEPDAETLDPDDIEDNSVELNGRIKMNDFNNGIVFYVYGQDESQIEDIPTDYDEYSDIDNDGDDLQKEEVDDDNDDDGWENYPTDINGLEEDERYYYRICVEFENDNGDDELECGSVEDFQTDDSDDNNDDESEVVTTSARNIIPTSAEMCGEITDDGGSSVVSWIEFRRSNESGFNNKTPNRQRGEVTFCERVSNLQPGTNYRFRACTEDMCGGERSFTTPVNLPPQGTRPFIFTQPVTNIRSNSATLNSSYVANAPTATCRFDYGRTESLGRQTRSYTVNGIGQCPHNFTNLASNTRYCIQSVIETQFGSDRGDLRCFTTPRVITTGGPTFTPPQVVVIEDEDEDLGLGFGLSLVRLEIDDEEDASIQGTNTEYVVEWENISELDLDNLDMRIEIPMQIQITDITRGRLDQSTNTIFFTIDELEGADFENDIRGERGEMSIFGTIGRGTEGNLLTAEAELAYNNPVNDAQENARDFDVNDYRRSQLTASVFGLANITFLGWLVILLGLFIIFLVARWLYLEREELRAQAYIGGYAPNRYNQQPQMPMYQNQDPRYNVPPAAPQMPPAGQSQRDDYYEPYRPNRG